MLVGTPVGDPLGTMLGAMLGWPVLGALLGWPVLGALVRLHGAPGGTLVLLISGVHVLQLLGQRWDICEM